MSIAENADRLRAVAATVAAIRDKLTPWSRALAEAQQVIGGTLQGTAAHSRASGAVEAALSTLGELHTALGEAARLIDETADHHSKGHPGAAPSTSHLQRPIRAPVSAETTGKSGRAKNATLPEAVRKRLAEGQQFNRDNWHQYPTNELILNNRKVLDSYVPDREIISRKHTQIASIKAATWQAYLAEHENKYKRGQTIKDTPTMREKYPDLVGEEVTGLPYMEVPVQEADVPDWALQAAARLGIRIRDVDGRIYELPEDLA
ncbi:hypothetical protein [Actinokineospora sp. NBRC 105648]|uniref:hypothetical protein n=1 Tax=Actinokineospora sp. NBRC 105648 TaxID=3032206 RepID=UPI0024A178A0|nr:hypothetical protein [Actinokineospora sp. NBRC 105648]GLZ39758.1 hypothetical protein Acsp05_33820 [Actinokineospora sp. NBRC 105648]